MSKAAEFSAGWEDNRAKHLLPGEVFLIDDDAEAGTLFIVLGTLQRCRQAGNSGQILSP
jgi:hypothetical protein